MMPDRRSFLRALLASPILVRNRSALAQQGLGPIGLQLYTVRAELQKDFEATLAKVAAIGYQEVELAGLFDRRATEIRAALQRSGLRGISSHVSYGVLGDQWPGIVEWARAIGLQHLVVVSIDPASRTQPGVWQRAAEQFNRAGDICKSAGIKLAYHNHLFEFARAAGAMPRPYHLLAEATDPSLVSLQMDLCWITAAGEEPRTYLARYPGRFVSVHVKDLKRLPVRPSREGDVPDREAILPDLADVGHGVIDWRAILPQCWSAGVRHYFVEHDTPEDPMASAERSFRYLEAFRFEAR